ncbi:hypothetical protein ABZT26_35140 [Streptomyces sp. NPDC005395]|uniref:hypothetical protein n=1 Tax=Streptomyces sp. NPDC005395 TaxID=3157042 RepID=UPI0033AF29A2
MTGQNKQGQFSGRQKTAPPVEPQPICDFDAWPIDPDGYMDTRPPIGSAADGPHLSGQPMEYVKYMVYGFLPDERKLYVEPSELMIPTAGGIDGYVARSARVMHGVYPYRLMVDLDRMVRATVHHRTGHSPSSLHTDRCDHPLVRNGEAVDKHLAHAECYELYACNYRAKDLAMRARAHGDECDSFRIGTGFCGAEGKQRALELSHRFEHARVKRVQDGRIMLTTIAGIKP